MEDTLNDISNQTTETQYANTTLTLDEETCDLTSMSQLPFIFVYRCRCISRFIGVLPVRNNKHRAGFIYEIKTRG